MMIHSYNDPVVYKANRVAHLKIDEFPPLSDKDYTKNLVNRTYNVRLLNVCKGVLY